MKWCLGCLFCLSLDACVTTAQVQTTFTKASIRAPVNVLGAPGRKINETAFQAEVKAVQNRQRPNYSSG